MSKSLVQSAKSISTPVKWIIGLTLFFFIAKSFGHR